MSCRCGCENCEERIRWLEDRLGYSDRLMRVQALRDAFGGFNNQPWMMALSMYDRKLRPVRHDEVDEVLPPVIGTRERESGRVMEVAVVHLRRALGADAVKTVWGIGYTLTPKGRALIEQALAPLASAA